MPEWFNRRYLDVLASIYLYNEHRGYTAIDQVLNVLRKTTPQDTAMIALVERHRQDERKHYLMFRRWFERRKTMPLAVDRTVGHIDRFVEIMFQTPIARLNAAAILERGTLFGRLCRVISLTERRGYQQVEILLRNHVVRSDPVLIRIFQIIHRDEPSHWAPYESWLDTHGHTSARWWERAVDRFIHAELLFVKLPLLFLNPWAARRSEWPDAADTGVSA